MPPIESGLGMDSLDLGHFEVILLRMLTAGLLGAFLGYRLWRRLLPNTLPPARETAQAQTLIAIAGALMVVVIGQSTARAFGLVGLGGFIRFRSGIKDTRDAAVMFVMIGIGMACGLGAVPMAVVATLFASVVLAIFDLGRRARLRLTKVSIHATEPNAAPINRRAGPSTSSVSLSTIPTWTGRNSISTKTWLPLSSTRSE